MICQPPRREQERYRQLRRIFHLAEILRRYRWGCQTVYLNQELAEETGQPCHPRTTYRDLQFMESCGWIEVIGRGQERRWKWIDRKPLPPEPLPPEPLRVG